MPWKKLYFLCIVVVAIEEFARAWLQSSRSARAPSISPLTTRLAFRIPFQLHLSLLDSPESLYLSEEKRRGSAVQIPPPFNYLVDVNKEQRSVIYEVSLSRDLGFDIVQREHDKAPLVDQVDPDSLAAQLGIQNGDRIIATSATAGDQMWVHNSLESVKSALATRFVMNGQVKLRLERSLDHIPEHLLPYLFVPSDTFVTLRKPFGLHVKEDYVHQYLPYSPPPNELATAPRGIFVQYIRPNSSAEQTKRVQQGDQIVAMSASWGSKLWDVNSLETFFVRMKTRSDREVAMKLRRYLPLQEIFTSSAYLNRAKVASRVEKKVETSPEVTLHDFILSMASAQDLEQYWQALRTSSPSELYLAQYYTLDIYTVHKLMKKALDFSKPDLAVEVFNTFFSYSYHVQNLLYTQPLQSIESYLKPDKHKPKAAHEQAYQEDMNGLISLFELKDEDVNVPPLINSSAPIRHAKCVNMLDKKQNIRVFLKPNNHIMSCVIKAYARLNNVRAMTYLLSWFETSYQQRADIFTMSALLYAYAKFKESMSLAETIFYDEIPKRDLKYTITTINSLMFAYAKYSKPDAALKIYNYIKSRSDIKSDSYTYSILIKALINSRKKVLQDTALEILNSLPQVNIKPRIEHYNEILKFYSLNSDYKALIKTITALNQAKPRLKLNADSYLFIMEGFVKAMKPKSALRTFHTMRKQGIPGNELTYIMALKALALAHDGVSALLVLTEMSEEKVKINPEHVTTAMFACLRAKRPDLAESIIPFAKKLFKKLDVYLCTLYLRALLMQDKWEEGMQLLQDMYKRKDLFDTPNTETYRCLLYYQMQCHRYPEALETWSKLIDRFAMRLAETKRESYLKDMFISLSSALGLYSSDMQKKAKIDLSKTNSQATLSFGDAQQEVESGDDLNVFADDEVYERDEDYGVYSNDEDFTQKGSLLKPRAETFRFLLQAVQKTTEHSNILIPSLFYTELVRALAMERQLSLLNQLVSLRESGKIRLKVLDEEQLQAAEATAERVLSRALPSEGGRSGFEEYAY